MALIDQHERVAYKPDRGGLINVSYSLPFFLDALEGADGQTAEINQTKGYLQNGSTISYASRESRLLTLKGRLTGETKDETGLLRRQLITAFVPAEWGTLQYEYGSKKYQIRVMVEEAPKFARTNNRHQVQDFSISLLAPDPDWQSTVENTQEIVTWIGGLSFPVTFPTQFAAKGATRLNLINQGDTATPITAEFVGPATNPRITNETTGEFIWVDSYLESEQTLVVTTGFNNKRIDIDGQSVTHLRGKGTTYFWLQPGDNIISYTSGDPGEAAKVKVSWRDRYQGV